MRNIFLATVIAASLISCNDNSDNASESTADSAAIENSIDTSNTPMQADTMQKPKTDTTAATHKKAGKKGK